MTEELEWVEPFGSLATSLDTRDKHGHVEALGIGSYMWRSTGKPVERNPEREPRPRPGRESKGQPILRRSEKPPEPAFAFLFMENAENNYSITQDAVIGAIISDAQAIERRNWA